MLRAAADKPFMVDRDLMLFFCFFFFLLFFFKLLWDSTQDLKLAQPWNQRHILQIIAVHRPE